jgi:cytochrome c
VFDGVPATCSGDGAARGPDGGAGRQAEERAGHRGGALCCATQPPGNRGRDAGESGLSRGRAVLLCCLFVPIVSFALAGIHPFGDAGLHTHPATDASIGAEAGISTEARSILVAKCADCHSNQTKAPLYSRFAPVSWLLERDVFRARKAWNLSAWNAYPDDKRQILLAQMAHETKSGEMPPLQYRIIHWNARISNEDLKVLGRLKPVPDRAGATSSQGAAGDPVRGSALFTKRCAGCHALAQNREGPRLQGVYGRASGSIADFAYSSALKKAHIVWDEGSLDRWLTDPDAFVAGNEMDFLDSNPQERRDIISYLRQSSGR